MPEVKDYGRTKYRRVIHDVTTGNPCLVDVYSVLEAFGVTCPARQHAIKKLLAAGIRGKGDTESDLQEAIASIERALSLEALRSPEERAEGEAEKKRQVFSKDNLTGESAEPKISADDERNVVSGGPDSPCKRCHGTGLVPGIGKPPSHDFPCPACHGIGERDR